MKYILQRYSPFHYNFRQLHLLNWHIWISSLEEHALNALAQSVVKDQHMPAPSEISEVHHKHLECVVTVLLTTLHSHAQGLI